MQGLRLDIDRREHSPLEQGRRLGSQSVDLRIRAARRMVHQPQLLRAAPARGIDRLRPGAVPPALVRGVSDGRNCASNISRSAPRANIREGFLRAGVIAPIRCPSPPPGSRLSPARRPGTPRSRPDAPPAASSRAGRRCPPAPPAPETPPAAAPPARSAARTRGPAPRQPPARQDHAPRPDLRQHRQAEQMIQMRMGEKQRSARPQALLQPPHAASGVDQDLVAVRPSTRSEGLPAIAGLVRPRNRITAARAAQENLHSRHPHFSVRFQMPSQAASGPAAANARHFAA
jgi:hypothetical protein